MLTILSYVVLGFAVGTFGTLVGIGGGVILVPIFLLIMHWTPQHAIGTSLTVVFFNALSGSIAYIQQKRVYYDAAIRFSLATLPGAVAGSYLATYFAGRTFHIVFGIFLMVMPKKITMMQNLIRTLFNTTAPLASFSALVSAFYPAFWESGAELFMCRP